MPFEHDLSFGRHLERHGLALHEIEPLAAQQTGELVFRQRIRHRRHGGEDGAGIGADHHRGRQRLALALRASAGDAARRRDVGSQRIKVRVAARHLHAVDAEVEAVLARPGLGPRVTTSGQVISGAGSPGQQVCTGR